MIVENSGVAIKINRMTAFTPTDIPAEINTVEKLEVWCSQLLSFLYPDQIALEATGSLTRIASAAPFYITASDPSTWRHISRNSIPLQREWQGSGNQIWNFAQEIGVAAIPASFKS
jgi:hypothetical protein